MQPDNFINFILHFFLDSGVYASCFPAEGVDYYQILGVSPEASTETINHAFRTRAREIHPDKNENTPESVADFKQLNTAHGVLQDPQQRAIYDFHRRYPLFQPFPPISGLIESAPVAEQPILVRNIFVFIVRNTRLINFLLQNVPPQLSSIALPYAMILQHALILMTLRIGPLTLQEIAIRNEVLNEFSNQNAILLELNELPQPPFQMIPLLFWDPVPPQPITMPTPSYNDKLLEDIKIEIPEYFFCKLSGAILTDPVHNEEKGLPNVERSYILKHLEQNSNNPHNPFTRDQLTVKDLKNNDVLKDEIQRFTDQHAPAEYFIQYLFN